MSTTQNLAANQLTKTKQSDRSSRHALWITRVVGMSIVATSVALALPATAAAAPKFDQKKYSDCMNKEEQDGDPVDAGPGAKTARCCREAGGTPTYPPPTGSPLDGLVADGCKAPETKPFNPQEPSPIVSGGEGLAPDQPTQPPPPVVVKPNVVAPAQ